MTTSIAPFPQPVSSPSDEPEEEPEDDTKKKRKRRDSAYVFSQNVLRRYNLQIDRTNWGLMNRDVTAEEDVPCTFSIDFGSPEEQTFPYAGCRYKGSIGSLRACVDPNTKQPNGGCRKLSLKVDVDEFLPDDVFDKDTEFTLKNPFGLDKFQFHGMPMDTSLLAERTAYGMFNDAGTASARATHAKVYINGNYHGIFVLVESLDSSFTEDRFKDDANEGKGALYKEILPKFTHDEYYREYHKDGKKEHEFMMSVGRAIEAARETEVDAQTFLYSYFDVPSLVDVMSINAILGQSDDWRLRHNFYMYVHEDKATKHKKLILIPWDYDRLNDITIVRDGLPPITKLNQSPFHDAHLITRSRSFGGSMPAVFSSPVAFPSQSVFGSSPFTTVSSISSSSSFNSFSPSFSTVIRRQFERGPNEPEWFEQWSPHDARCRVSPKPSFFKSVFETMVEEHLPPETELPIQCDKLTRLMALVLKPMIGRRIRELAAGPADLHVLDQKWSKWSDQIEEAVSRDTDGPNSDTWERSKLALGEHIVRNRDAAMKLYP